MYSRVSVHYTVPVLSTHIIVIDIILEVAKIRARFVLQEAIVLALLRSQYHVRSVTIH